VRNFVGTDRPRCVAGLEVTPAPALNDRRRAGAPRAGLSFDAAGGVERMRLLRCVVLALALGGSLLAPAAALARHKGHDHVCANKLCTKDRADVPSCWRFSHDKSVARCFVKRAAAHYHQSKQEALVVAHRESRMNWRVTNRSSGAAGLFQFMRGTWVSTPYGRRSVYHPRWASLAAMWLWARGGKSHWPTAYSGFGAYTLTR
jgi:hypothetical protein